MKGLVKIVPRRLKSGGSAFLVSGTVAGKRIQRQFADHALAKAEADRINVSATTSAAALRFTRLSDDQLADAEAAREHLANGTPLIEAVKFYNEHFRPVSIVGARKALDAFLHAKLTEDRISQTSHDIIDYLITRLFKDQEIVWTSDITAPRLRRQIHDTRISRRTARDRFDCFRRFCDFLVKRRWIMANPLAGETRPPEDDPLPPTTFTVDQCAKLLQAAWTDPEGPEMLPYFAMCALSGVRPTEMMRAKEHQFFLDEGHTIFEVWRGKTAWRSVELLPCLVKILRTCRDRGLNLCFFSKRKFNRIRTDAGVFASWDNDILRHSFASYHYAAHRDIRWLEANLGNSERVLFRHYIRRTVRPVEAQRFMEISVDFTAGKREKCKA